MKSQYRMLFAFVTLLMAVSLACSALGGAPPTAIPTNPPLPTNPPPPPIEQQPTVEQPPVEQPQQPSAPITQKFFTEEFDSPLTNAWSSLTVTDSAKSDPDKVTVEAENGKLTWDFDSEYVYYYLFYEGQEYDDVKVEVQADNRGRNNNNVSLICRYDPRVGWYEFNIANNGLYNIFYAEITSSGSIAYNLVANGGSNAIKQGKDINEYSIVCSGNKLTLTINGKEVNSLTEKKYALRDGYIGISVSSFNVLPILIDMDWLKISEP
jgi:hypothetical protein